MAGRNLFAETQEKGRDLFADQTDQPEDSFTGAGIIEPALTIGSGLASSVAGGIG